MTATVGQTKEALIPEDTRECRGCLKKLDSKKSCCNIFQAWAPPWEGMEATIAEDLAKLANVEVSKEVSHHNFINKNLYFQCSFSLAPYDLDCRDYKRDNLILL